MEPVLSGDPGDERTWHGWRVYERKRNDPPCPRRRAHRYAAGKSACRWRSTPDRCTVLAPGSATPSPGRSTHCGAVGPRTTTPDGDDAVDLLPYVTSARAKLRPGERRLPVPAALAHRVWARTTLPTMDRWLGHPDVVHGTNYVVPPTRRAAARERVRLLVRRPSRPMPTPTSPAPAPSCGARSTRVSTSSRRRRRRPIACASSSGPTG